MTSAPPRILAIAGSDSSGGAGVQADIKTITMLGGYAMTAITAVTAQNTVGVQQVEVLAPELVRAQIESCLADIGVDAVKIGMLGSPDNAEAVADALEGSEFPIVFDPVMVATSGSTLADEATIAGFERLATMSGVVTPNLPELEVLAQSDLSEPDGIYDAAMALSQKWDCAVLAKGGHGESEDTIRDILVSTGQGFQEYEDPRIETQHTHGTGCTLSSAIATLLGHGQPLGHAVTLARKFVRRALENAPGFGAGSGPLGHQAVWRES